MAPPVQLRIAKACLNQQQPAQPTEKFTFLRTFSRLCIRPRPGTLTLSNLSDSRRTEWTLTRMPAWRPERSSSLGGGRWTELCHGCPQVQHHAKDRRQWVNRFRAEGVDGLHDRSHDHFHRTAKHRKPHAKPSRSCADSATPASISQLKLVSRLPRPQAAWA